MNISLLLYALSRLEIALLPDSEHVRVSDPHGQAGYLRPYLVQYKSELVAFLRYCRPFPSQMPLSIGPVSIDHDLRGWWLKPPYNKAFAEDLKDQLNRMTSKRNCSWVPDRESWWVNDIYIVPALDLVAKYFAPDLYASTRVQTVSTQVQTAEGVR